MKIRDAYVQMIKAYNGGWAAMAAALGMKSNAALHNRVYEVRGQELTVNEAIAMQSLSNTDYFAAAVAEASGGVFLKLPDPDQIDRDDLLAAYQEAVADMGELSRELIEDTKDGEIDDRERARILAREARLQKATARLVALNLEIFHRSGKKTAKLQAVK